MKVNKLTTMLSTMLLLACFNVYLFASDYSELIKQAVDGSHRSEANRSRDVYRHPLETLSFFGLKADMNVLEILPGRGWYTEILAPVLKEEGELTIASFGEDHANEYLRGIHNDLMKFMDEQPEIYGKVNRKIFQKDNNYLDEIEDESLDMVLTFRNTHNWIRYGGIDEIYPSFHRILKKGGILGVVQHRADNSADAKVSAEQGYVPESYLIRFIEDMGFELVDKSEVNANAKDGKNYPKGVWTLPPSYRLGEEDREEYRAIGESDRMTLKFIKI